MNTEVDSNWEGRLTYANYKVVAESLGRLLVGEIFTTVTANEFDDFLPVVTTNQILEKQEPIQTHDCPYSRDITVRDSFNNWRFATKLEEDHYDGGLKAAYFQFRHNKVTITYVSHEYGKTYVVFMVQSKHGHPCG